MKRNSKTLGFLPRAVLEDYLERDSVLGVKTQDGQLVGYLLYGNYPHRFRIAQLCVGEYSRGQGIARRLLEALKSSATTQKSIRLNCRNDFPAHKMWRKLGFVPIDERPGRSKERHLLTTWRLPLALDDQLELFRANISETVLDVVMDAQVFFHLDEPDSDVTRPSKMLISDIFFHSVNLWFTDELFSEIIRNRDAKKRQIDRQRARQFFEVKHDPIAFDLFSESLKRVLPSGNESQISDINHLAKAAASEVNLFVTSDKGLLSKAKQVAGLVNLQVLSPTELILRLNELSSRDTYQPDLVSGLGLAWRRLASDEHASFPFNLFLNQGEPLRQFRRRVDSLLADPTRDKLEVLWSDGDPIALRSIRYGPGRVLTSTLGRVANSRADQSVQRFLISDLFGKAIRQNLEMVKFETSTLPASLILGLSDMGFTRTDDHFLRFCFARHQEREDTLKQISRLAPEAVHLYRGMTSLDLERSCSPLSSDAIQNHFLIPIRPHYALNLFDRSQSARDMFGGNPDVLLLWRNVYYRSASYRNTLKAPGRILWYVSRNPKAIVAVSHLDKVVIDMPKELFRRFKKIGTLNSEDLYEMCGREPLRELMAIQFSHTFLFEKPVALDAVRKAFEEDDIGFNMQSPRRLQPSTFRKLFELGYPERS